jgi:class 3 adenylate cyclase
LQPAQVELAANTLISQSPALAAQYRVILALVNLASGRRAEATAELDALTADDCAAIPRDWNWLDNLRGLAILSLVLRDARRGAIVYELMRPYADRNITAGWGDVARGSAALYLASLARLLRRLDEAEGHCERALQLNQRMGARPSVARTQFEYARVLLERDRPGNQERARALLAAALATACELGMRPLEARLRTLLERKGWPQDVPADEARAPDAIEAVAAAVVAEPRELRAHAAPHGTVTILISDMKDSSALFDTLGDLRAQEIINTHNAIVRQQVARQKGFVVKSMGDGFMLAFSSARRAVLCAIAMQRAFAAYSEQHRETPIQVRMGLHVGEPINVSDDLYGKPVIVAARIAALAQAREILVSSTLRDLTESAGDLRFSDAGTVELKGLSGTHHLHRVVW